MHPLDMDPGPLGDLLWNLEPTGRDWTLSNLVSVSPHLWCMHVCPHVLSSPRVAMKKEKESRRFCQRLLFGRPQGPLLPKTAAMLAGRALDIIYLVLTSLAETSHVPGDQAGN